MASRKKRHRRTKAQMAADRAAEAAVKAAPAGPAAPPKSKKSEWTPGEDIDHDESLERNQADLPARNRGFDKYLLQEFASLNAPWSVVKNPQKENSWAIMDKQKKVIANAISQEVAEAITGLPYVICTYTSVGNVFAMTDVERDMYHNALHGLYNIREFLHDKNAK